PLLPYDLPVREKTAMNAKLAPLVGSLGQLSLPDLLQTAEASRRSGVILLRHRQTNGTLWLRDGRVADAEIEGSSRGREAVYEMALWDEGTFEADFSPVAVADSIFEPTSALLLEAMRRRDEAQRDAAPPHAAIPDPPPPPPRPLLAVHRALTLLNVASSYASEMLEPALLARRLEQVRRELLAGHPALGSFRVSELGAVSADGDALVFGAEAVVRATALWLRQLFALLEQALPGRFPLRKLRQITEAVQDDLESLGFNRELGFDAGPGE
ncbi:MAG TPA: DUF4388 domain-containing protein, partial [Thermoanaerobaculia bacterium]|nr:DUF4388 domain-containing protein [Thermoanaerobaculia bacterium]